MCSFTSLQRTLWLTSPSHVVIRLRSALRKDTSPTRTSGHPPSPTRPEVHHSPASEDGKVRLLSSKMLTSQENYTLSELSQEAELGRQERQTTSSTWEWILATDTWSLGSRPKGGGEVMSLWPNITWSSHRITKRGTFTPMNMAPLWSVGNLVNF